MQECWEALPTPKSFQACGISVYVDDVNDSKIHCLKDGGVAAAAQETVTSATAWLLSRADEEDNEDPFAELEENEDELSENKLSWRTANMC